MSMFRRSIWAFAVASAAMGTAACGGDGDGPDGGAFLTIVGDDQLFVESGSLRELRVRYHDGDNDPIAGTVAFDIVGNGGGSSLSRGSVVTDSDGMAIVNLQLGDADEASFQIEANAAYVAEPAQWDVALKAPPFEIIGRYNVESQFSLAGIPSDEIPGLNLFLDITNSPNDPATWILDQAVAAIDVPFIADIVNTARTLFGLDALLNDYLLSNAPDFVNGIIALGDDIDELVRTMGLRSTLDITGDNIDDALNASHEVTGAIFWVNGVRREFTRSQLQFPAMMAPEIGLVVETRSELTIQEHAFHLLYGELLVHAINNFIVEFHTPPANSLTELVAGWVDCEAIGVFLADQIAACDGVPICATVIEGGCVLGIDLGLQQILDEFREVEADLLMHGDATLLDTNRDYTVEKLNDGEWEGSLGFSTGVVALPRPDQKFVGTRISPEP